MRFFITIAGLAAAVAAIQIEEPQQGSQWDFSASNSIIWTTVETDPDTFSIQLLDNNVSPPSSQSIASNVNRTTLNYTFSNFVTTPGPRYIIEFTTNTINNTGIITESQEFNVTKSGVKPTSPTTGPSGTGNPGISGTASATLPPSNAAVGLVAAFAVAASLAAMAAMLA